jgi:pyruvate dehydrogenase E2 component (dihydrolipoamide acetyltransferase)
MPFYFKLPDLGEGIKEGEVVKWHVHEGDLVEEHQVIMEVETDKAIVEVPSPKKGKVIKLNKAEGETVLVGEVLLTIDTGEEEGKGAEEGAVPGDEAAPAPEKAAEAPTAPAEEAAPSPPAPEGEKEEEAASVVGKLPPSIGVLASPKGRALARERGVDISKVAGTGPGGIITEADVLGASGGPAPAKAAAPAQPWAAPPPPPPPPPHHAPPAPPPVGEDRDPWGPVERVPIRGIRKSISRNLLASQRNTASVTGMDDADVTDLWNLRNREKKAAAEKGVTLTFLPFFMKAVRHAIEGHPLLNGSVDEERGEIILKKYFNVGVAVDTPEGLMVAVLRDVDKKTILELAVELQELSKKARERKITIKELKGSTFTITNYGSFGGRYATPIINYPDIAILGTGRITERPWVVDGKIVPRMILPLSLTFDHRVVDGIEASTFLARVKEYLEDPNLIFIESA